MLIYEIAISLADGARDDRSPSDIIVSHIAFNGLSWDIKTLLRIKRVLHGVVRLKE